MADQDVLIEFGAKIDKLTAAVEEAKAKIGEVSAHAEHLTKGFEDLKHIVATAFSVEAIIGFIEKMSELGDKTERTMAMLGMSAKEVGMLSGMAKLTGTSMDGLQQAIERTALGIQNSTRDAFTPQAAAMRVLGLNAKELIGVPTSEYIERLHQSVVKFNPSLNLTNALMTIGGRNVAQMIPLLHQTGEKWEVMKKQITDAQEGLAHAVPGMADTNTKLGIMSLAVESFGARIFTVMKPAIDWAVQGVTKFIESMDSHAIEAALTKIIDVVSSAVVFLVALFEKLYDWIAQATGKITSFAKAMENAGYAWKFMTDSSFFWSEFNRVMTGALTFSARWVDIANDAATSGSTWAAKVREIVEEMKKLIHGGDGHGETPKGKDASGIDVNARSKFDASITAIEAQNQLWQGWLTQQKVIYQADADMWRITEDQKLSQTRSALNMQFEAEMANLSKIKEMYRSTGLAKEAEDTNRKILLLQQSHATEMIRINADMARNYKQKWDEVFGGLQGAINGQLRGLLAGTTSWRDAFRNVLGDMVIFFIQMVEKMVFQWIAGKLAMMAIDKTAAATTVATEATAQATTLPLRIAKFTSDITADAALVFAGIFASLAPILGPAAAGPAGAGEAVVLAQMAAVPKFELGTDYVPYTGLAVVHQGEKIIPASQNKGGGGAAPSIHISAWDGASVASWLKRGGAAMIAKAVGSTMTLQRSTRPKF